jgi:hypothetical protein
MDAHRCGSCGVPHNEEHSVCARCRASRRARYQVNRAKEAARRAAHRAVVKARANGEPIPGSQEPGDLQSSICDCSRPKVPGDEACPACFALDGFTAAERDITSALRVLGGSAQLSTLIEDLGYGIDEETNGPGYRKAMRGLAELRARGCVSSVAEFPERMSHCGWERWRASRGDVGAGGPRQMKTEGGGVITYSLRGGR